MRRRHHRNPQIHPLRLRLPFLRNIQPIRQQMRHHHHPAHNPPPARLIVRRNLLEHTVNSKFNLKSVPHRIDMNIRRPPRNRGSDHLIDDRSNIR